jgi:aminoglycoside phosphotransferase (APT) family kinase protein
MFAMEFFPPEDFPVWKAELAAGHVDPAFAGQVGRTIARIHAATAGRKDIADAFANDAQFLALRLDPFLLYVAARHADVADRLRALARDVAAARIALMHGDVSPKNILCGPNGPVFLDAETTCYGDPAFDLAFCLTHILLKSVWHPRWADGYGQCFAALAHNYLEEVAWEPARDLETRAARLLPALLLARVDGKSPAEYLTEERQQIFVRGNAKALLMQPGNRLDAIAGRWTNATRDALA